MTIREIVTDLLDNSPETVFSLWGLADTVGLRKGESHLTYHGNPWYSLGS